jgi:membrane associated rhomboid family serine protease
MAMSITLLIVIITSAISLMAINNKELFSKLLFSPFQVFHSKEYYRILTHAVVHGGWVHLFVNMYVLYIFGRTAETYFGVYDESLGELRYVILYLGGIVFATLPSLKKHKDNFSYNSVGASGAVSAILFSCIAFNPTMPIIFIFLPIPMPAILFGVLYLVYEAYMDKNSSDSIAHDAHYYGAVFGILYTFISLPSSLVNFFGQIMDY